MKEKERKLTPAEQKRKAEFDVLCENMAKNGYQRKDLTVGVLKANIIAVIIMLPFAIAALIAFILAMREDITLEITTEKLIILFIALLLLSAAHEAIHGLCRAAFSKKGFRSIRFGIIWSALTPYCTCSECLTEKQYIFGAVTPTVLLGFIPAAIAVLLSNPWVLLLSVIMIFGGGADFYIALKIILSSPKNSEALFYDHPYECGVVAFIK